jgi:PPOX class probable F420-dependent enzyme
MAKELSAAARSFLEEKRFAVLATINRDGTPQQTVMWYELRDNMIVMNTAGGRIKDRNLKRDQRVSVCVSDGYTFVTIAGTVRLDDNQQVAQADIRRLAIRYHGEEEGNRQANEQFSKQHRISIYLPLEHVLTYGFDE